MKNKINLFISFSLLFMLNSCSMPFYFYIQNFTSEDQKITLTFYKDVNSEDLQHKIQLISSKVTQFRDFRKANDKAKLNYIIEDYNKISVILPRNSLTYIDYRSNNYTNVTGIEYIKNKVPVQISKDQLMMKAKYERMSLIFELK
ncbi:hypothetical protein MKJ01_00830 [Chryseobacterium sp. SSA4.19]|uniref:hypothetical protein n=1 Tax=Chryseobacterium sp. SSA4.19 TaxID=2919915 RepID=UPI001F4E194D|nr:hypothetical protein [Chryseobacterium sp. SSA4.19]MCJ8152301.1 hypothetical protein [Chryseobacterium sp. SSA4.19]